MKRVMGGIAVVTLAALGTVASVRDSGRPGGEDRSDEARVRHGFALAPVPLDLHGRNRARVGLGSYLVNAAGGCNDCHTCPPYAEGHDPFSGGDGLVNADNYLAGGTAFGPFVSRNLTPDEHGLPAGLTPEEFVRTIRTGHDPEEPGETLQVMPWPVYRNLTDHDLLAIYTYLSAIPHAEPGCAPPPPQ